MEAKIGKLQGNRVPQFPPDSGGFLSPTCTMVLLKLHCDVTEATLSAFVAKVKGGRGGGSPTRLTDPPVVTTTLAVVTNACVNKVHYFNSSDINEDCCNNRNHH